MFEHFSFEPASADERGEGSGRLTVLEGPSAEVEGRYLFRWRWGRGLLLLDAVTKLSPVPDDPLLFEVLLSEDVEEMSESHLVFLFEA